jgi:hypothetical protein
MASLNISACLSRRNPAIDIANRLNTFHKRTSRYQSGQLPRTAFMANFRVADRTITKAKELGLSGSYLRSAEGPRNGCG